jgi:hypothetical protein
MAEGRRPTTTRHTVGECRIAFPVQIMKSEEGSADWGRVVPSNDHDRPSLLVRGGQSQANRATSWVWLPPEDLKGELPEGFNLAFRMHAGQDGLRRVAAVGPPEYHIPLAWMGGLVLLSRHRRLDPETRQTYRMMWLLYQRASRMRPHLRRSFKWWNDLTVSESGRAELEEDSVIPIQVEAVDEEGRTRPVRPRLSELQERGYRAARAAGIVAPSVGQAIHYALVDYAKANPLVLADDRVPELVRASLFDVATSDWDVGPEELLVVYTRVFAAVWNHAEDTTEKFNEWFWGRKNSFVKQIAQQRRAERGQLQREHVRRALLRLGWDAHQYVAGCLSLQMQAVAESLPEPLNAAERRIFEEMHLPQPHYGNLPLLLLGERLEFVESVVLDLCDNPGDPSAVQTLHRLLQSYAVMADQRRQADRERKRKPNFEYDEARDLIRSKEPLKFSEIAGHILDPRNQACECAQPCWDAKLLSEGDPVTFSAECSRCHVRREVTLPLVQFATLAREYVDNEG